MMKAKGTLNGREVLLLGLSHDNLNRFLADPDSYIPIKGEEINIPFDIVIFSAKTEHEMYELMRGRLSPDAKIHLTDKFKVQPHTYVPSAMHMGDCAICGHLQGAAIHKPTLK
jgi:hypothetical protein